MNQESGIKNHGRAAAWLVWIGAFFVASVPPLQHHFLERWAVGAAVPVWEAGGSLRVQTTTWYHVYWPGFAFGWLVTLGLVAPSVLATRWGGGPRFDRATLIAFLPLSAALSFSASSAAEPSPLWGPRLIRVPPGLATAGPAAGFALAFIGYAAGVSRPSLARFARRWLAASILWVILLEWIHFDRGYYPGWVGAIGAGMILVGETLARPAVILDS